MKAMLTLFFVLMLAPIACADLLPAAKLRSARLYSHNLSGARVYSNTVSVRPTVQMSTTARPQQQTVIVSRCRGGVCRR